MQAMSRSCGYNACATQTTSRCSRCRAVSYCSVAHQVADWKDRHRFQCHAVTVAAADDAIPIDAASAATTKAVYAALAARKLSSVFSSAGSTASATTPASVSTAATSACSSSSSSTSSSPSVPLPPSAMAAKIAPDVMQFAWSLLLRIDEEIYQAIRTPPAYMLSSEAMLVLYRMKMLVRELNACYRHLVLQDDAVLVKQFAPWLALPRSVIGLLQLIFCVCSSLIQAHKLVGVDLVNNPENPLQRFSLFCKMSLDLAFSDQAAVFEKTLSTPCTGPPLSACDPATVLFTLQERTPR